MTQLHNCQIGHLRVDSFIRRPGNHQSKTCVHNHNMIFKCNPSFQYTFSPTESRSRSNDSGGELSGVFFRGPPKFVSSMLVNRHATTASSSNFKPLTMATTLSLLSTSSSGLSLLFGGPQKSGSGLEI